MYVTDRGKLPIGQFPPLASLKASSQSTYGIYLEGHMEDIATIAGVVVKAAHRALAGGPSERQHLLEVETSARTSNRGDYERYVAGGHRYSGILTASILYFEAPLYTAGT